MFKRYLFILSGITLTFPGIAFANLAFDEPHLVSDLGLPQNDLTTTVLNMVSFALGFFGLVALIMIIYGGFVYLTAGGSEEKIDSAKDTLRRAVIGMVIVMLSYSIITFVYNVVNSGFITTP